MAQDNKLRTYKDKTRKISIAKGKKPKGIIYPNWFKNRKKKK